MTTLQSHTSIRTIGEVLHAAHVLGHRAWNGEGNGNMSEENESTLGSDVVGMFSLLRDRNVRYLLVGGVALLKYIDGRNTQDIDLLISLESLQSLPEIRLTDRNPSFARGSFNTLRVDLLLTSNPLFSRVEKDFATTHKFNEMDVRCATVEGLILLKLYALPALYRAGDGQRIAIYETDVLMLCQRYRPSIEPLLEIVRPHVDPAEFDELRNIVSDIDRRLARMDRAKQTPPKADSSQQS